MSVLNVGILDFDITWHFHIVFQFAGGFVRVLVSFVIRLWSCSSRFSILWILQVLYCLWRMALRQQWYTKFWQTIGSTLVNVQSVNFSRIQMESFVPYWKVIFRICPIRLFSEITNFNDRRIRNQSKMQRILAKSILLKLHFSQYSSSRRYDAFGLWLLIDEF